MRNVSDNSCRVNQNAHFILIMFFFFEILAVFEIKLKKLAETDRPQMTIYYGACALQSASVV